MLCPALSLICCCRKHWLLGENYVMCPFVIIVNSREENKCSRRKIFGGWSEITVRHGRKLHCDLEKKNVKTFSFTVFPTITNTQDKRSRLWICCDPDDLLRRNNIGI